MWIPQGGFSGCNGHAASNVFTNLGEVSVSFVTSQRSNCPHFIVKRCWRGKQNMLWMSELTLRRGGKNACIRKEKNGPPSEWAWNHLYAFLSTLFIYFFTWAPAVYKSSCGAATLHFSPVNTHFNLTGDSAWHKLNHLPLYNHLFQKDTERETEQPVRIMWIDCKSAAPTWLQSR